VYSSLPTAQIFSSLPLLLSRYLALLFLISLLSGSPHRLGRNPARAALTTIRIIFPAQSLSQALRFPPAHTFVEYTPTRVAPPRTSWEEEAVPKVEARVCMGMARARRGGDESANANAIAEIDNLAW
jgi:hypothetical protein